MEETNNFVANLVIDVESGNVLYKICKKTTEGLVDICYVRKDDRQETPYFETFGNNFLDYVISWELYKEIAMLIDSCWYSLNLAE